MRLATVFAFTLLAAVPAPAAATPFVVNGSFETDVVSGSVNIAGGGLTGWTVTASPDLRYPNLLHDAFGVVDTPFGSQAVLLGDYRSGGLPVSFGAIQQTVSGFSVGSTYVVSFAIATQDSGCGGACGQAALTLSFLSGSSTPSATFVATTATAGGGAFGLTDWTVYSYNFVASSSNVTLLFAQTFGVGPGLIGGVGLDAVAITSTGDPAAVPEPASLSLLAIGLAAVAARRINWRKRVD